MYKLYITLLLDIFTVANAMMENKNPDIPLAGTSSSNPEPYNVLPLTLINSNGRYTAPNRMSAKNWTIGTNPLNGKVEFTTNYAGEQIFLCKMMQMRSDTSSSTAPISDFRTDFKDDNCAYPVNFSGSNPLRCTLEPEPIISKLKIKPSPIMVKDVSCSNGTKRGKMYRVVFQICITKEPIQNKNVLFGYIVPREIDVVKRFEFEIYRLCIDEIDNTVMYTEHKISSPELLNNPYLQQERRKVYDMTIEENNPFKLSKDILKIQYDKMKKLRSDKETLVENIFPGLSKPSFKAQKFVPPDDFAFALWRKATFNYLNGEKMKSELIGIWERICQLIRNDAIKNKREYYIHTSVYELLPQSQNMNLSANEPGKLSTNPTVGLPIMLPPSQSIILSTSESEELPANQIDELPIVQSSKRLKTQTEELPTNQVKGQSSRFPYEVKVHVWMKIIYHFADEKTGDENFNQEPEAIAIMVDNNFKKNEYFEEQLNLKCGKNQCENILVKRFPEVGRFVRCCSLINNKLLQGMYDIEINRDLLLEWNDNEFNPFKQLRFPFLYDDFMRLESDLDLFNNLN